MAAEDGGAVDERGPGARSRRQFLRALGLAVGGGAVGAVGATAMTAAGVEPAFAGTDPHPRSGPGTARDKRSHPAHGKVDVVWSAEPRDPSRKLIALTFDDGPAPLWTPQVLDHLDAAGVPGTFFLVGRKVAANKGIIDGRIGGTGRHEAGNHTWAHVDLATLGEVEAADAIRRSHDEIALAAGAPPTLLRPPFGSLGGTTLLAAANLGYRVVLWSMETLEWEYAANPAGMVDHVAGSAFSGAIVLSHDTGKPERKLMVDQLPALIDALQGNGFELVTVTELLAAAA